MSSNPFESPATKKTGPSPEVIPDNLASLSQRFYGFVIDTLVMVAMSATLLWLLTTAISGTELFDILSESLSKNELRQLFLIPGALLTALLNAVLVTLRGQSIGKIITGTKIVRHNGEPLGFIHGVLLRSWLLGFPNYIFRVIGCIDYLFIFLGRQRHCLHDRIASTHVISLDVDELPDIDL